MGQGPDLGVNSVGADLGVDWGVGTDTGVHLERDQGVQRESRRMSDITGARRKRWTNHRSRHRNGSHEQIDVLRTVVALVEENDVSLGAPKPNSLRVSCVAALLMQIFETRVVAK